MNRIKSIWLSILFIATALVMTMDLCCELPKIPNLLAHFSEHQEQDNHSFLKLVMEHYAHQGSGQNDHDEGEHDHLPFHGSHTCHHAPVVYNCNYGYIFASSPTFIEIGNCGYQFSFTSIYLETPFQPPQQA